MQQELLGIKEAADLLGVHENTLRNWDRSGFLKAQRHGKKGTYKYDPGFLRSFLGRGKVNDPVSATLPTDFGDFLISAWPSDDGKEVVALSTPSLDITVPVLVRVHSECLTGDVLHSSRCDCGTQKDESLRLVSESGNGVFIYLRQEGRGIGLYEKIRAYQLQEKGYDTFEANMMLGHEPDVREYSWVKVVLDHFGAQRIRLVTNNPSKVSEIAALGFDIVERVPLVVAPKPQNRAYLEAKHKRFKHFFGEESNYFFQFSYAASAEEVEEIGSWIEGKIRDPYLRICVGVYADAVSLGDPLEIERIASVFKAAKLYRAFVPILHFTFAKSENPIKDLNSIRTVLPFVEYIQLNDIGQNHLAVLRKACEYFLVDIPLDDETFRLVESREFRSLVTTHKAFVCIDNSKGSGKQETFESLRSKIDVLLTHGLRDIAVYGGFGPGKLSTYFRLRKHYKFPISIDAESQLSTGGRLDTNKVKLYLSELLTFSHAA